MPRFKAESRLIVSGAAAISLVVGVLLIIKNTRAAIHAPPPIAPPTNAFIHAIAAEGLVEPKSENISIAPAVPGLVTTVRVKALQQVRAGEVLWVQDRRNLTAEVATRTADVATAQAAIKVANAALADARVQLSLLLKVDDRRAIREEDLERRQIGVDAATAQLLVNKATLLRAQAALNEAQADVERLTVTAPLDGQILKVDVRAGEYAVVPASAPLIVMGDTSQLNVRVDIAEEDVPRFSPKARAYGSPRGNARRQIPLEFVRIEPRLIPKVSLTGDTTERVDTRVMQAIYKAGDSRGIYDGEQMDVFIEAPSSLGTRNLDAETTGRGRTGP